MRCAPQARSAPAFHRLRLARARGWRDFQAFIAGQSATAPAAAIAPDDECNLIYSSGTTALPKGIIHTHACRMHWAYDAALALRYRNGCRTLFTLGLFSNISWVTMLATMLVGGTLVLLRTFSPRAVLAVIEAEAHHARRLRSRAARTAARRARSAAGFASTAWRR